MHLVLGRDAVVADWVARRIPHVGEGSAFGPCAAIGVEAEDGAPLGGVVFSGWQPECRSIEVSFASASPRWLTRRLIGAILSYPFVQLDCQRITALTPRRARAARRFIDAFGFKREGLIRRGFGDDDAVVSGMLRREWEGSRWVQKSKLTLEQETSIPLPQGDHRARRRLSRARLNQHPLAENPHALAAWPQRLSCRLCSPSLCSMRPFAACFCAGGPNESVAHACGDFGSAAKRMRPASAKCGRADQFDSDF
jgi:RimJ/RimL family protein N-acetyltransferase